MENVYYVISSISSVVMCVGVVIALRQYFLAKKQNKALMERESQIREKELFEMEKDRIQRAIDLSGFYKDNIIDKWSLVSVFYSNIGIEDIMNKIKMEDMQDFNYKEINELLTEEQLHKLEHMNEGKEYREALTFLGIVTDFGKEYIKQEKIVDENGEEIQGVRVGRRIEYKYNILLQELLNNLEYFALHFTHKTADESVVYQSLHDSYLSIVKLLYYDICNNNRQEDDRLFTNVVELFHMWREETCKQKNKAKEVSRSLIKKGSVL